jgi:hypothetical protein
LTFREVKQRFRIHGSHCHHLVPIELIERRAFAYFFGKVRAQGFEPNDFSSNGMHLPCFERRASAFSLPLHRGAHPRYNQFGAERIAAIEHLTPKHACFQISLLQQDLRRGLRSCQSNSLQRPRNLADMNVDFRRLDADVDYLFGERVGALGDNLLGVNRV